MILSRSQWPCGLRYAAAWLLGLWVQSHLVHGCLSLVFIVCCVHCIWNVMAHMQKSDFVFWQNGWVHLNWRRHQFSWLLAAEVCASVVVMLDTQCSEVVWRVLATHSIRHFPLHCPSHASPCAITFQLDSSIRCDEIVACLEQFY